MVKSLCWNCMYFLPQFQNNYQKSGPNCSDFTSIVVQRHIDFDLKPEL